MKTFLSKKTFAKKTLSFFLDFTYKGNHSQLQLRTFIRYCRVAVLQPTHSDCSEIKEERGRFNNEPDFYQKKVRIEISVENDLNQLLITQLSN